MIVEQSDGISEETGKAVYAGAQALAQTVEVLARQRQEAAYRARDRDLRAAQEADRRATAVQSVDKAAQDAVALARKGQPVQVSAPEPGQRDLWLADLNQEMTKQYGSQWASVTEARTKAEEHLPSAVTDPTVRGQLVEEAAWRNEASWTLDPKRKEELTGLMKNRDGELADAWVKDTVEVGKGMLPGERQAWKALGDESRQALWRAEQAKLASTSRNPLTQEVLRRRGGGDEAAVNAVALARQGQARPASQVPVDGKAPVPPARAPRAQLMTEELTRGRSR